MAQCRSQTNLVLFPLVKMDHLKWLEDYYVSIPNILQPADAVSAAMLVPLMLKPYRVCVRTHRQNRFVVRRKQNIPARWVSHFKTVWWWLTIAARWYYSFWSTESRWRTSWIRNTCAGGWLLLNLPGRFHYPGKMYEWNKKSLMIVVEDHYAFWGPWWLYPRTLTGMDLISLRWR